MLKTLAMLAMESTMTADKNIYSNQRLSNEKMQSKDLKQEGNYETDSRSSD